MSPFYLVFPSLKSGEKLYTIKIYKGRHEIIQYVPEKSDRVKVFPRKGINVQVTLQLIQFCFNSECLEWKKIQSLKSRNI